MSDDARQRWFLSSAERGNTSTRIDTNHEGGLAWTTGNEVEVLVHGATYFRRLHDELCALERGDRCYFTDWRGDADQLLLTGGPTIRDLLCELAKKGVEIRGLVWRSHSDLLSFSSKENDKFGKEINHSGGEVLLDQRVKRFGSHHQKLFIVRQIGRAHV